MKLTLRNIGAIRDAELDLRPLTVFVGPNNTNKSWAAYAAYSALGSTAFEWWMAGRYTLEPDQDRAKAVLAQLQAEAQPLIAGEMDSVDLVVPGVLEPDHRTTISAESLAQILNVPEEALPDAQAILPEQQVGLGRLFSQVRVHLEAFGSRVAAELDFRGAEAVRHTTTVARPEVDGLINIASGVLSGVTRWRVEAFPVERHLLFTAPMVASSFSEDLQGPAHDFLRWVNRARARTARGGGTGEAELVDMLHARVFGGEVTVGADGPVQFVTGGVSVPVHAAASMVRSLAPLSLYLRTLARPGDVLVIDEPEMNAHPRAQLALAELFCALIRRGYRLLITTHSPYLVEHLGTLMEASRLREAEQEHIAEHFLLGRSEAFLDPDQVAVYEFETVAPGHVEVRDILDRDQAVIDTRTFADWTNRMGELLDEVLDAEEA